MEYFDTHAHLDDAQLSGQLDAILTRAREACVAGIVTVGTTADTSATCVELARRYVGVWAAVGIQPNHGRDATPGDWDRVVACARDARVRAIGETGLDAYWDHTPWELQQRLFADHIQLAQATGLPLIIHMRDCGQAVVDMLAGGQPGGALRGVMHSFTGTAAIACECLALGLHISFSGIVTFKKSTALREVARLVPDDRLLIETDAPYLSPHPHRSQRPNEPALLPHTAQCLADLRGVPLARLAEQTTANARRLFGIPGGGC
ncbi:MAG: TatD family hydrolase [Pirellulaceae bacterium]|jgi:TatD DNase family protein|nr:TatD family hydrolase [Pirellulaceae bacterium]